uniref:Putative cysteine-rich protein n=1 Tax=Tityus obscurus TaxID=1221240 RepID=A0A1E1WVV0_TITOB
MWIHLLIWALLMHSLNSECDKKYSDITVDHSMCKPKNETCQFMRRGYNKMRTILKVHNDVRNNMKPIRMKNFSIPTNMLKMEWDDELYQIAKKYVRQCVEKPDCPKCHQTGGTHVEQNFAVATYTLDNNLGPAQRFRDIILQWADELRSINDFETIRHFQSAKSPQKNWVNLFRASTYKVGCDSMSYKVNEKTFNEIYVCNYAPATIEEGEEIYKGGKKACSECPPGMGCDSQYKRLCAPVKPAADTIKTIPATTNVKTNAAIINTYDQEKSKSTTLASNEVLWKCDFSDRTKKQCESEIKCLANWKTVCELKSCHKEIIIDKPNCSLLFLKPILVENHACLIFQYKKEHLPAAQGESNLTAVAVWNEGENYKATFINDNTNKWTLANLHILAKNQKIQIGFIVRNADNSEGQKISIRKLYILNGSC